MPVKDTGVYLVIWSKAMCKIASVSMKIIDSRQQDPDLFQLPEPLQVYNQR